MNDLNKAREWVGRWEDGAEENDPFVDSEEKAAIKLIRELPDQWVDEEKLKAIIADMDHCLKIEAASDFSRGVDNATTAWRDALKALLTPKPPTLADMTPEERLACQFMQARLEDGTRGIIVHPGDLRSSVILERGGFLIPYNENITPLPGEPKLKWPGSKTHALPEGMRLADHDTYGRVVVSPRMDSDREYKAFCSDPVDTYGTDWQYIHESSLTFLDGE